MKPTVQEVNHSNTYFARERGPAWRRATTRRAHSIDAGAQAGSEAATGTQIWRSATARVPRIERACAAPKRMQAASNAATRADVRQLVRSKLSVGCFHSLAVRAMPAAMRFCDAFLFRKGLGLRYQGSLRGGGPQNFVASSV